MVVLLQTNNDKNKMHIISPEYTYDINKDARYLIPFINDQHKFGMINHNKDVIIKPVYDIIYDDCFNPWDLIRVGVHYTYGFLGNAEKILTYLGYKIGLVNSQGSIFLPLEYRKIIMGVSSECITLQSWEGGPSHPYGVCDNIGTMIVPFGKYDWIDGFDNGYARVNKREKWGIINSEGDEVLPVKYDKIWNFYNKGKQSTRIVLDKDVFGEFYFNNCQFVYENEDKYEYKGKEPKINEDAIKYGDKPQEYIL